jgi:hypothetical protein
MKTYGGMDMSIHVFLTSALVVVAEFISSGINGEDTYVQLVPKLRMYGVIN